MISVIVAHASNLAIGANNDLLWHISEDLKYFKRITGGHTVIMGRNTFESIGRPLPNRRNIVISSTMSPREGVEVVSDFDALLQEFAASDDEVFIIGGGKIYAQALKYCQKLYVTEVDKVIKGADTYFPDYSALVKGWKKEADEWQEDPVTEWKYRFVRYEKVAS